MSLAAVTPIPKHSVTVKMSDSIFKQIREFIYLQTGIYFQDSKKYLLEGRLGKRIQILNLATYEDYLLYVKYGVYKADELNMLYDAVTINETFFFRNEPQFEEFEKVLIPQIIAKHTAGTKSKIRIWSAASSSGEEAYSIGMLFTEKIKPLYPEISIEIIGTDISPAILETARVGVYREYSVRNMPKYYLDKYFDENDGRFSVAAAIKKLARFEHLNLYDKPSMRRMRSFDIIFCCNVLIYFDTKSKIQVVSDLYNALNPGGFLFIGYAETLHGISSAFKLINFPKTVVYKKE